MFTVPEFNAQEGPASLFHKLNGGPDFRAIANDKYRVVLPEGWRLSYGYVSPTALVADTAKLRALTVDAFDEFERVCSTTLLADLPAWHDVKHVISRGVEATDGTLRDYLSAGTPFSVRRLDIVVSDEGPTVSENDEMPGGLVDAYWLDRSYGVNQERWKRALEYLTANGPLVFVVSDDWGRPYIPEVRWFVAHLREQGYAAHVLTTSEAEQLDVGARGVYMETGRVGTIYRLFPIFEAKGVLADIVRAASDGLVRLVPELASWGNKSWFAVFWQELDYFRSNLSSEVFELLCQTIPSSTVASARSWFPDYTFLEDDFPQAVVVDGEKLEVESYDHLLALPKRRRGKLVLKAAGAHRKAARSYGVVIGRSHKNSSRMQWEKAIDGLFALGAPVVMQAYSQPTTHQLPLWSVLGSGGMSSPEFDPEFDSRVLLRPWSIGGELVTCTAFVSHSSVHKLHGTTRGAQVPLDLN